MLNVIRSTEYYVPGIVFWSYTLIRHISTRFTHSDKRDLLSNVIKLIEAANQLWQANILQSLWNPPKHQQKSYPFSQGTKSFAKLLVLFLTVSRSLLFVPPQAASLCFCWPFCVAQNLTIIQQWYFSQTKNLQQLPSFQRKCHEPERQWLETCTGSASRNSGQGKDEDCRLQGSWNYPLLGLGIKECKKSMVINFEAFHFPLLVH